MICKCCGAVKPSKTVRPFEEIPGNEHVKRAIEIAVAGKHSIGFVGNEAAEEFAVFASGYLTAYAVKPCPCGNFNHPTRPCDCSGAQIRRRRRGKAWSRIQNADLVIQVPEPSADRIVAWATGNRRGETWAAVQKRIDEAENFVVNPSNVDGSGLGESVKSFMKEAVKRFGGRAAGPAIKVAATIARLAQSPRIETHHYAEAVQYLPREDY